MPAILVRLCTDVIYRYDMSGERVRILLRRWEIWSSILGSRTDRSDGHLVVLLSLSRQLQKYHLKLSINIFLLNRFQVISPVISSPLCNLSYDRSTAICKAILPDSATQYLLFQVLVVSHFLQVIQQLLTSFSLSFPPFYLPFNKVFHKAV